ncbi:MAG: iron-sulfur cluster assembly protein [Nanoarchaeota archaeon]
MITKEKIIDVLKECYDPEIRVDVYNLGLIYNIDINNNIVNIKMTLTSMFCPYGNELINDIKARIKMHLTEVEDVNVEVVFDPPWNLPDDLRAML